MPFSLFMQKKVPVPVRIHRAPESAIASADRGRHVDASHQCNAWTSYGPERCQHIFSSAFFIVTVFNPFLGCFILFCLAHLELCALRDPVSAVCLARSRKHQHKCSWATYRHWSCGRLRLPMQPSRFAGSSSCSQALPGLLFDYLQSAVVVTAREVVFTKLQTDLISIYIYTFSMI